MEDIRFELVFNRNSMETINEMKTIDTEVSKVFITSLDSIRWIDMSWLIKRGREVLGYTDLIIEKETLNYYMNLALKPGYRNKDIMKEVLNLIKVQALSNIIYFEKSIDRDYVKEGIKESNVEVLEKEKNDIKVYQLNLK